jgi:hypothetical protein
VLRLRLPELRELFLVVVFEQLFCGLGHSASSWKRRSWWCRR